MAFAGEGREVLRAKNESCKNRAFGLACYESGAKALDRHTVAALLNDSDPDIDYWISESDIASMFTVVSLAGNEDLFEEWIEDTKDTFEYYNSPGLE